MEFRKVLSWVLCYVNIRNTRNVPFATGDRHEKTLQKVEKASNLKSYKHHFECSVITLIVFHDNSMI